MHIQEGWYKPADIWWISYPAACVDRWSDCAIIRRNQLNQCCWCTCQHHLLRMYHLQENKASHRGTEPISVLPFQRFTPYEECLQTKRNRRLMGEERGFLIKSGIWETEHCSIMYLKTRTFLSESRIICCLCYLGPKKGRDAPAEGVVQDRGDAYGSR